MWHVPPKDEHLESPDQSVVKRNPPAIDNTSINPVTHNVSASSRFLPDRGATLCDELAVAVDVTNVPDAELLGVPVGEEPEVVSSCRST